MRSAPALTPLGLGTSQMGNLGRATSDEDAAAAFAAAWDSGIRYFDTAPHYGLGLAERRLGALLGGRDREQLTVSTKVGRLLVPDAAGAGRRDTDGGFDVPADHRRVWDFTADGVRRSVQDSLERLGLDRLDVVYLHDPDEHLAEAVELAVPALVELRDQGVLTAIGAGMNSSRALAHLVERADLDIVMCAGRYTLLEQPALDDLLPLAAARGVAVVLAGVYNSGLLAHRRPPADATYDSRPVPADVLARAHAIADVCDALDVALPAAALAFARAHPTTASVVVGGRDGQQVRQTVAHSSTPVPVELWDALRARGLLRPDAPTPG